MDVSEIVVKVGDTVEREQSLVTLESDKATMDVPSPVAGIVKELKVKVGDAVLVGTGVVLPASVRTADQPVLNLETLHPREFLHVVCDDHGIDRQRVRSDQHVVRSDQLPPTLKVRAQFSIKPVGVAVQRHD